MHYSCRYFVSELVSKSMWQDSCVFGKEGHADTKNRLRQSIYTGPESGETVGHAEEVWSGSHLSGEDERYQMRPTRADKTAGPSD